MARSCTKHSKAAPHVTSQRPAPEGRWDRIDALRASLLPALKITAGRAEVRVAGDVCSAPRKLSRLRAINLVAWWRRAGAEVDATELTGPVTSNLDALISLDRHVRSRTRHTRGMAGRQMATQGKARQSAGVPKPCGIPGSPRRASGLAQYSVIWVG